MSVKRGYTKPAVAYSRIQSDKPIARPCWSPTTGEPIVGWYNDPGFGGIEFSMSGNGGSCGATESDLTILKYLDNSGNPISASEYYSHHPAPDANSDSAMFIELTTAEKGIIFKGSQNGNNFDAGTQTSETPPDWKWSV